jgi:serine/threonine-protein kinase
MTTDTDRQATLIQVPGGASETGRRTSAWTLPADLQGETVRRLRTVALVYALAFFLAGPFISLLFPASRALLVNMPRLWVPAAASIVMALGFAALLSQAGVPARLKVRLGLAFEVLASFGITAAEYHHIAAPISYGPFGFGGFGLSWVAPWVMLFSVFIPAPPRVTLVSAALSILAVPLTYQLEVARGTNIPLHPGDVFLDLIFPYLVVLMMAYVAACVVYGLGTAVRKARELGSYQLVERLGKGGMGEVWRARHRMLARPAAIKLIRPEVLGAGYPEGRRQVLHRFEREAQATAVMRSSHTIELYDFGAAEDGTFYYVMELLEGFDLERLVERFGPVPAERAVHLLLQICDSLAEAHEAGLIHRDVKPANVFACRYGREVDFVKVLDFGLVKLG